jgi:3-phosphoshikimate 1-carboxyvinyltransferase
MYLKSLTLKQSNVKSCEISLPGSKSISNRVLLIASLSVGVTKITNLLFSDDTKIMIQALKDLGIKIEDNETLKQCIIIGSPNFFPIKKTSLYVGNAGTAVRPLTAVLAFNNGDYRLHGTDRMHERPIEDLVNSLNSIGAKINYLDNFGFPPLHIRNSITNKNTIEIKGNISSQFLTSILIASPIISQNKKLKIVVTGNLISKPYVNITLKLLQKFKLKISEKSKNIFEIYPFQKYISPSTIDIEGDASSASYFLAAAAISGKSLKINGLGSKSIQGDLMFVNVLKKMGVKIKLCNSSIEVYSSNQLKSIDADLNHIPDAAMTVAMLALYADGPSFLRNIGSWRVKETDRLSAMSNELKKLGAAIDEGDDFLKITPSKKIKNAIIDTYDDHRMAMCFSLASLNSPYKDGANIIIKDPNCVAKTFPNYFDVFKKILD